MHVDEEAGLSVKHARETTRGSVHTLELTITSELGGIDEVNERFNAFAGAHAVPDAARRTFNIAFDDLLNNIVSYAYRGSPDQVIDVRIELAPDCLEASVSDDGPMFDPFALESPDVGLDLEERIIGGLGVHLVRTMMDEVQYHRLNDRNVVTIRKYLMSDGDASL